jgi:hypothetical protein
MPVPVSDNGKFPLLTDANVADYDSLPSDDPEQV